MALVTREELELLLSPHERPCVSLFLPTHRHHPGTDQDPIRLKNLLQRAARLLSDQHDARLVRELLEPIEALLSPAFWSRQKDGLAIFRSSDLMAHYRLPDRLEELVVVADSFHVRPVARFLQSYRRFYVLALAQKSIALFEGTPEALAPVAVDDLPSSILDTLGVDRSAGVLNLRTLPAAGRPALFHGQGAPDESKKSDLVRLFREVDRALWSILRDESAPLVLAGVAYYLPLYREVSRYRNLLDRAVEGSFDGASPQELHARAWPVVREAFASHVEQSLSERALAAGRGLAREDLATIAKMVVHGRVRRLLLADGARVWGTMDPESGRLQLADGQRDAHDDDVLDDLAENVLVRGGEVLAVPPGRLPGGASASALLRW